MKDELCFAPALEVAARIRRGELSPVDAVRAVIERADRIDPHLHSFITRTDELALKAAQAAEQTLVREGPAALGPLAGLAVSVKDLLPMAGVPTTFGAAEYRDNIPAHDSPSVARIRAAGASLLGKTSTPPFGWSGTTENDIVGITNNPWRLSHSPGGSSGGAGAAVAAGLGPLAVGSDGGGSIRVPGALCGIVGLKPSHGRIPRGADGLIFETVDAVGPMARTVADVALLLQVMAGPVEDEPYMLPEEGVDYVADLRAGAVRGLRVAFSADMGHGPVDSEVARIVADAVRHFETALGASVTPVDLGLPDPMEYFYRYYPPTVYDWARSEPAMAGLRKRYPLIDSFIESQRQVLSHDYLKYVHEARQRTFLGFAKLFPAHDVLITPTTPTAAWPHDGERGPSSINGLPVALPHIDPHRFTEPCGHSGHPALTLPCGFTSTGLPVGLQIIAAQRNDRGVLRAAAAYEATTQWMQRRPPLPA